MCSYLAENYGKHPGLVCPAKTTDVGALFDVRNNNSVFITALEPAF